jgi:hypothetical protein
MNLKEDQKQDKIARTGRVESWINASDGRLPVSCTVFSVKDSMEGDDGIEASWRFVSHGLRYGAGVAVHLSELRGKGAENEKGLVASGPISFGKIYSTLNEILRRGGLYKNGAIVLHLDYDHPDALEFIKASRKELPWVKRCLNVDPLYFLDNIDDQYLDAVVQAISAGDLWLNKIRKDAKGERIRANVCLEVYLPHRGTCLLQHVNLGACSVEEVEGAFFQGMSELCSLHSKTGVGETGEYLSPENDKQVGLGLLGLANFLSIHGISYADFGQSLKALNNGEQQERTVAYEAALAIQKGIASAAQVARNYSMDRAFAIAPTASCSYRYTDSKGFTTAPEIAPPIAREVDRDSGTFGVESFDYGPVETASEVGWEAYKLVADELVRMYQATGLFHGYSFNSWSDIVTYNREFLQNWLDCPQTSLYYSLQVLPDTQRKDDAYAALDDDFKSMFGLSDLESGDDVACEVEANFCTSCSE